MRTSSLVRTLLFCPGDRGKAIAKALTIAADVIVIDLEDAVHASEKVIAREQLCSFLSSLPPKSTRSYPKIVVRVNCPSTTSFGLADIASLVPHVPKLDGLCLPKVDSLQTLADANEQLFYGSPALASPEVPSIWAMVESCAGLQQVERIAHSPLVAGLVFGSNDMLKDLKALPRDDRLPLLYAMSRTIAAARVVGKQVVDGVYMNLADDGSGLRRDAQLGKSLGFDGKSLIHPRQVDIANDVFSPSADEVRAAQGLVDAFSLARAEGKGVCVHEGRLVESLHVDQARELLGLHASILARLAHRQ